MATPRAARALVARRKLLQLLQLLPLLLRWRAPAAAEALRSQVAEQAGELMELRAELLARAERIDALEEERKAAFDESEAAARGAAEAAARAAAASV